MSMIPIENLAKVGNKCFWLDPAINEYPKRERKKALKRVFVIVAIQNDTNIWEHDDDIILIADEHGTEVEVTVNELAFL